MPWDQRAFVIAIARSHAATDKPGMTDDGYTLPDEERVSAESKIRWAAGAMDKVTTHQIGKGENDETVRMIVERILAYSRQPTAMNKAAVYQQKRQLGWNPSA